MINESLHYAVGKQMNQDIYSILSTITEEEQMILEGQNNIDRAIYTEDTELIVDSEKLLQRGKLIEIRPHTRFVHFPPHKHNYIEFIYMYAGETTHIVCGESIALKKGELLFLNQNAIQEILPARKEDVAVNFIILPEFFDTAFAMMGEEENPLRDFMYGCLTRKDNYISYLHFEVSEVLPIQNLLENMIWSLVYKQVYNRSINQITMGLLFLQLINHMDKLNSGEKIFEQEIVIQVLHYIEEHYRNGSLTELAGKLNYDLYWISRAVKKYTGKTYKELLQIKRLNQAVYLLSSTSLSVETIVGMIGYSNKSYFYKVFKRKYSISPQKYREKHRKDNCK